MSRISVNFWNDYTEWMRSELCALGHTPPVDGLEVAAQCVNLRWRRVRPRIRSVTLAKRLFVPAHRRDAFNSLIAKMSGGDDINPNLSRSVLRDANYNDALLNDWGMHHFHLGTQVEADGFVQRTSELVFAIVHWDRVFVVAVGRHGEWTAERLIDAVEDNWPEQLTPLALESGTRLSPMQRQVARNRNVFALTVLRDGRPVIGPGGGYATSGRSIGVSMRVGRMRMAMAELQERFMAVVPAIETYLDAIDHGHPAEFRLTMDEGRFVAVDNRAAVRVVLCTPEEAASVEA